MPTIMIHRPLPTREGRMLTPGVYTITGTPAWIAVHTESQPSMLMGTMSFEALAKAEQEGWLTELRSHASYCNCRQCKPVPVDDNPFRGDVRVSVTPNGIAAQDSSGALIGSRVV